MSNLPIVIRREYLERVSKLSFIITTLLMPLLMLLLSAAPALLMQFNSSGEKHIAVIDLTPDSIAAKLTNTDNVALQPITESLDSALTNTDFDGVLYLGPQLVSRPDDIKLYTRDAAPIDLVSDLEHQLDNIIETIRIEAYGIDDLRNIIKEVQVNVDISTMRINDSGDTSNSSSMLSYAIGVVMTFILYMFLIMYGQMVMTSIIEEKNNRVLEIIVSSVKPAQLMMGKIIGVGLVAVTQVVLWGVLIALIAAFVLPAVLPADIAADMAAYSAGTLDTASAHADITLVQALSMLGSVGYIIQIFAYMLLFLIGGFLFYAAINAAIGSAVDNIQDASQFQSIVMMPILIGFVVGVSTVSDPNSSLALWLSIIPFTSPMVMMARIPFEIPQWQILVSLIVLYISFVAMVWFAAKIYRVGIFMYGKKPTLRELIRWARYK